MKQLLKLLRQKTPKSGVEMPHYFRSALATGEILLVVYFVLAFILFSWINKRLEWVPLLMCAGMVCCRLSIGKINCRLSFYGFELVIILWCAWHTSTVGWGYGAQHLLIPMLMLCFFNIYEPPLMKITTFLLVLCYRMALFAYSLEHPGYYHLDHMTIILYQTINSVALFNILAVNFIVFSSSIQESERQLLINNQALHKEAGTDPLTGLPNRRFILDVIDQFRRTNPQEMFCVAIVDIDFFKNVNDTYGHNCGDYTLKCLAELFRDHAKTDYIACRWGGEEFCFFLPGKNLDEASVIISDVHIMVGRMPLNYGDAHFNITITAGIEENDFRSPIEDIFDRADRKLYMGKVHGRNQVVV